MSCLLVSTKLKHEVCGCRQSLIESELNDKINLLIIRQGAGEARLSVVMGVVQQCKEQRQALNFLLDMQSQRVAEALPANVQQLFREARLWHRTFP